MANPKSVLASDEHCFQNKLSPVKMAATTGHGWESYLEVFPQWSVVLAVATEADGVEHATEAIAPRVLVIYVRQYCGNVWPDKHNCYLRLQNYCATINQWNELIVCTTTTQINARRFRQTNVRCIFDNFLEIRCTYSAPFDVQPWPIFLRNEMTADKS